MRCLVTINNMNFRLLKHDNVLCFNPKLLHFHLNTVLMLVKKFLLVSVFPSKMYKNYSCLIPCIFFQFSLLIFHIYLIIKLLDDDDSMPMTYQIQSKCFPFSFKSLLQWATHQINTNSKPSFLQYVLGIVSFATRNISSGNRIQTTLIVASFLK